MNQDDFKKILDEALEPIKEKQDIHSAELASIKNELESHSESLETLQASVVNIESKLDTYGDMYKINDSNVRKVERRVEILEDKAGVIPPQEHTLADVS